MKRFLALLAAAAMVAAAVLVRGWLDDRGDASDDGDDGGPSDEQATLLCDPALVAVCRQLEEQRGDLVVEVVDAASAFDRFADPVFSTRDDPVDGWLVPAPFPAMVDEARQRGGQAPVFDEIGDPLARSPLVIAMWVERADALAPGCPGGEVGWRCIGDAAGRPWGDLGGSPGWGRLEPGFEDPATSATGLLIVGQASTAFFDTPSFASNDFDRDGFRGWLRNLEDSVPSFPATAGSPLRQMLVAGPATYDLAGTTEAEAGPAIVRSRDRERLRILYPSPMATADVQFAPVGGAAGAERLGKILADADTAGLLAAAGWRVDGQPLAEGLDADLVLPDGNGLPRPGVMQALRDL